MIPESGAVVDVPDEKAARMKLSPAGEKAEPESEKKTPARRTRKRS